MRDLPSFRQQIVGMATDFVDEMPLLRWLSVETGQGTANMGIVAATIACLVWAMLLLSGADLRPGINAMSEATQPLRQQIQQLIDL